MAVVLVVGSQLGSWHLNEGEVWGEQGGRIRVRWDLDTISRGFWSSNCSREEI